MSLTFQIHDRIVIADPCQTDNDEHSIILQATPGQWAAQVEITDDEHVKLLALQHPNYTSGELAFIGKIPVDTGMVYAGDTNNTFTYEDRIDEMLGLNPVDNFNKGVLSHAGYGDNWYPVHAFLDNNGRALAIEVTFID